jgi:CheY-like chemotaxis protein
LFLHHSSVRGTADKSEVGLGSTSLDSLAALWTSAAQAGGDSMNALRTLVVEDDAMIAGLLEETLEGLGHGVCAVETNVAHAVAAASRWQPDLMIVDIGLGEASGIAAVKEILRGSFVPHVFFVTGSALNGLSLGPDTVLIRKPFRVSDLDQAIQRALSAASACDRVAE